MELVITENAVQLAAIKEKIIELFEPYQSLEHGHELTKLKAEINRYMDDASRANEPLPFPKLPSTRGTKVVDGELNTVIIDNGPAFVPVVEEFERVGV